MNSRLVTFSFGYFLGNLRISTVGLTLLYTSFLMSQTTATTPTMAAISHVSMFAVCIVLGGGMPKVELQVCS